MAPFAEGHEDFYGDAKRVDRDSGTAREGPHFVLTGVSATDPIEGDPLSEAVVGVHVIPHDDFVGCTEVDELPRIVERLDALDVAHRLGGHDYLSDLATRIHNRAPCVENPASSREISTEGMIARSIGRRS